jgi:hypothetical protein
MEVFDELRERQAEGRISRMRRMDSCSVAIHPLSDA